MYNSKCKRTVPEVWFGHSFESYNHWKPELTNIILFRKRFIISFRHVFNCDLTTLVICIALLSGNLVSLFTWLFICNSSNLQCWVFQMRCDIFHIQYFDDYRLLNSQINDVVIMLMWLLSYSKKSQWKILHTVSPNKELTVLYTITWSIMQNQSDNTIFASVITLNTQNSVRLSPLSLPTYNHRWNRIQENTHWKPL